MNFSRAFARDIRLWRSAFQTSRTARSTGSASSAGTKTPTWSEIRGQVARPPPSRSAKPSRPSLRVPTSATQWISGALHWCGQAAMVILCFRGRSQYSGLPLKKVAASSTSARVSNSSSASRPETGQPVMLRTVSPQPLTVVNPASSRVAKISGSAASSMSWSCTFCRVVSSA